jgi:Bromodomain
LSDLNRKLSDIGIKTKVSAPPPQILALDTSLASTSNSELDQNQKEELVKEFQSHQRRIRQVFTSFITDLKKTFRPFTKSVEAHLLTAYEIQTPMDLSIMQNKIEQNVYELPDDFMNDMRLILSNVIKFNDRDLITKARKLIDSAEEDISLLTSDFRQQCWYFYLFKRSGVIPGSKNDTVTVDESDADIDNNEELEIPATQIVISDEEMDQEKEVDRIQVDVAVPIPNVEPNVELEDYPFSPIEDLPADLQSVIQEEAFHPAKVDGFAEYLALNTASFSVQDLEDISSSIAMQVVQDGKLDISTLRSTLGLDSAQ